MTISDLGYVSLTVDAAYALDFFSILDVKCIKTNEQNDDFLKKRDDCANEIINQISLDLYKEIINSPEYKELFNTNYKLFSIIDLAKKGGIDALQIDNLNYERFKIKKKIQEKFFGTKVKEIKLGYEE